MFRPSAGKWWQGGERSSDDELSLSLSVIVVFVTLGFVNTILLSPLNPLRGIYWNLHDNNHDDANSKTCTVDHEWILNWLAFGHFHVSVLIASLAYTSKGNLMLEQRLVWTCVGIMVVYLSNGTFMLDHLNRPMAALQCMIYLGWLSFVSSYTSTAAHWRCFAAAATQEYRSCLWRKPKAFFSSRASVATLLLFLVSLVQVVGLTFGGAGGGRRSDGYLGDSDSPVYQIISSAALSERMLVTLILAGSLWIQEEQQQGLLAGHVLALFVSLIMLSGSQGESMEPSQLRAAAMATFVSILIATLGAL